MNLSIILDKLGSLKDQEDVRSR